VASVVGSIRNPLLYYVGSAGGGVWKTLNGGATWQPMFDKQGVPSIGAIAIDPTSDSVVWVGTGETNPRNDIIAGAGLYKSTDGGKTWILSGLAATLQISSILIDPTNPNHVVVGAMGDLFADSTERGVYVTDDGGKTWRNTLYLGPQTGVSDMAADAAHPNVIYAGMWQFRRLPWTFTSGGPSDGLFKSTDGGATWARLSGSGLPIGITGRIGLAVAPSDPNRVYALIESKDGILWRSDDAGATWKLVSKNTLVDQRPFYFSHIAVDPKDAQHVYGISEMLSESKDGGATFKEIAHDVHVDYHSMWIAPNDPHRMIVGEDGGYALTLDGEHWSDNENLPIGQIYHLGYDDETPYRVCVSLQDNNGFCGPSNALDPNGNPNRAWERVIGGDGMWAWPDPSRSSTAPRGATRSCGRGSVRRSNRSRSRARNIASTGIRRSRLRHGTHTRCGTAATWSSKRATTAEPGARSAPTSRATTKPTSSRRAARSRSTSRARSTRTPSSTSKVRDSAVRSGSEPTMVTCSSRATADSIGATSRPPASHRSAASKSLRRRRPAAAPHMPCTIGTT
jgi:photosystem II stability/assembly factor-like uncharacterized protein